MGKFCNVSQFQLISKSQDVWIIIAHRRYDKCHIRHEKFDGIIDFGLLQECFDLVTEQNLEKNARSFDEDVEKFDARRGMSI